MFECRFAGGFAVSIAGDGGGGGDDGGVKNRRQKNAARFPGFCRNCCIH